MSQPLISDSKLTQTLPLSKGDQTKEKMIIAAIEIIGSEGFFAFSYESIAKRISTSRQHVRSTFSGKSDLMAEIARRLRLEYQKAVLQRMDFSKDPHLLFQSYIHAALQWPLEQQVYSAAWLAFLCCAATDPDLRKLHSEMSSMGAERIASLIEKAKPSGRKKEENILEKALLVQGLISGALITVTTENLKIDRDTYLRSVEEECVALGMKKRAKTSAKFNSIARPSQPNA